VAAAVAAKSAAKLIRFGWQYDTNYAQEPSPDTVVYPLVRQKARLEFGDNLGGFQSLSIPAPISTLFESTTQDNLIVVNPASVATIQSTAQALLTSAGYGSPRGVPSTATGYAGFYGGQLVNSKPPVRRVLQGA